MHALIDLETMGNSSFAPIVAIGAVKFNPYTQTINRDNDFYMLVDLESSMRAGMQPDASTIYWWLSQSEPARKALLDPVRHELGDALADFAQWYQGAERFWCHGATFDAVILSNAYGLVGMRTPFSHRDVRDTRTLFELAGIDKTKTGGVEHNALDDAYRHAIDVQTAYRILKPGGL
jgi:hypothetical protein